MQLHSSVVCVLLAFTVGDARFIRLNPELNVNGQAIDDYLPCKRQVSVYYDLSSDMPADTFARLQDFLKNQFFTNFNHFERLGLGQFDSSHVEGSGTGDFRNLNDVQREINLNTQSNTTDPDIRFLFDILAKENLNRLDMPGTIIILTGKFNEHDAKKVSHYAEQIKQKAYLSVFGVQATVDQKTLDKVADFSYSFDLSKGVPNDIQKVIEEVHGCNF